MKIIFLSMLFLLTVVSAGAQDNSRIRNEINKLEQQGITAILNKDTATLEKLWAPEFLVNNPRSTITRGRDSVLLLLKAGMINYSRFERVVEEMQVQKDLVISMGHELFVSVNDTPGVKAGQLYKRRYTNIWMKQKGKWLQIARHASIICQ